MTPPNKKITRHPLLETGSWDYIGASYDPKPVPVGSLSFTINHEVEVESGNYDSNLIVRLLSEGLALYACEIVSPRTVFRKLEVLPAGSHRQTITINKDEVGIDKSYIRPMIVSGDKKRIEADMKDGLHPIFKNKLFDLQKGTILAKGRFFNVGSAGGTLMRLHLDPKLKNGRYSLSADVEDSLIFQINLAPDLYQAYYNTTPEVEAIFLTGIFANILEWIARKSDKYIEDHPNIKLLLNQLGRKDQNYEEVLERIKEGHAAELASDYRPIKIPRSDDE